MKKLRLHSYQIEAANFINKKKRVALFADPGMGKTSIILSVLKHLQGADKYKRALIVAPSIVCSNTWPNEIYKWKQFKCFRKYYQVNPRIRKNSIHKMYPDSFIHLVNFESIPGIIKHENFNNYDILIIDESSKMKNPSSVRFKALKNHLNQFKVIVVMSGTPTPKSLLDLWSQIYIIDSGKSLRENITAYRNLYFNMRLMRIGACSVPEYTIKKGARKKILKAIAGKTMVLRAKDYLNLKDPIINDIQLNLTKEESIIYRQMEKNLFTEINNAELFALNAGSSFQKCHQLANGAIWDGSKMLELHTHKLDALENLIDELQGKPLLVGYRFTHDLKRIIKRFGKKNVSILDKNNPKIEKQWNRGKHQLLCGQLQSVSHGLNLQKGGRDICFFSLTSNWEDYNQFIKRIWRQGVNKTVRIHRLIIEKTVDKILVEILEKRCKNQIEVLKILKGYRLAQTQICKNSGYFYRYRSNQ